MEQGAGAGVRTRRLCRLRGVMRQAHSAIVVGAVGLRHMAVAESAPHREGCGLLVAAARSGRGQGAGGSRIHAAWPGAAGAARRCSAWIVLSWRGRSI